MLLFASIFLVVLFFALVAVAVAHIYLETKEKRQLAGVLSNTVKAAPVQAGPQLINRAPTLRGLQKVMGDSPALRKIEKLLLQSGTGWSATQLMTYCVIGCIAGAVAGTFVHVLYLPLPSLLACALFGLSMPYLWAMRKRGKTLRAFESQFPEALDFLSRSMRAGHGFSISLELLAADAPEPMATCMRRVSNELQLGSNLGAAFEKLADHIPLVDVRFFIATVLLQQETGGNLAEVLGRLAYIIRERFKLHGDVQAASAHGRITAMVLMGLPVFVALFLVVCSPDYLAPLTREPEGHYMIFGAITGQLLGFLTIRQIVNIKV